MTKSLAQMQQEWLDSYFTNVTRVWEAWKENRGKPTWGGMTTKERDETLMWYRRKLWELRQANNKDLTLPTRGPRREDEWLENLDV